VEQQEVIERHVLDSWAILAHFQGEDAGKAVRDLLSQASDQPERVKCLASTINLGEVFYIVARKRGIEVAETVRFDIEELPIEQVAPDWEMVLSAARYKARAAISYADGFVLAAAKRHDAKLWTGDPELKSFAGEIKIKWLG
jgi:predicted nucleic acid-binding protein